MTRITIKPFGSKRTTPYVKDLKTIGCGFYAPVTREKKNSIEFNNISEAKRFYQDHIHSLELSISYKFNFVENGKEVLSLVKLANK